MKINRHGKAKILNPTEVTQLFEVGLTSARDRALFGVCFYTGCRIAEACSLRTDDIYGPGDVRSRLTLRKGNTKGKRSTRSIPVRAELAALLAAHHASAGRTYVFPGRWGRGHIHPDSAAAILRGAVEALGVVLFSKG